MTLAVLVWLLMLLAAGVLLVMVLANLPHHKNAAGHRFPAAREGSGSFPEGGSLHATDPSRLRHVAALSAYGVCDAYVKNRRKRVR